MLLEQPITTSINILRMFKTSNEFSLYIEQVVNEKRITHMDAILEYCKENYLEPQDIAKLVNKSLKEKVALNMQELNYLPKKAQLDV
jgi:KaiC/GvpD/RAD55 family RecA-like ATPase